LIERRQTDLQTAISMGQYAVFFDDPNLINTAYEKFSAVTAAQVKEAAAKYLVAKDRAVVTTLPPAKPAAQEGAHGGIQ
jgi:predicted Zn-dependent peptidase